MFTNYSEIYRMILSNFCENNITIDLLGEICYKYKLYCRGKTYEVNQKCDLTVLIKTISVKYEEIGVKEDVYGISTIV